MHVLAPADRSARARIALLVPRWTAPQVEQPQGVPFRSFTLGAALLRAGFELVFFDQEHDLDRANRATELVEALRGAAAAFVWLNECYPTHQYRNALRLGALLEEALPALPLIAGGEMITLCPAEFFMAPSPFDYFLRGYGEATGVELVERLLRGASPEGIPGLVRRRIDGTHELSSARGFAPFEPELLELYRHIDLRPYIQTGGVFGNDQPTLSVAFGRGCTKGCAFCCWRNHKARILGADPAFELLRDLRDRYGVRQFHIGELDFFVSRPRAFALAERVRAERPDIGWYALGSPVDLADYTDEDWAFLRAGGLRKVEMGSESGSARLLRAIGKRHAPEDIYEISVKLLRHDIVPMNNFLFGFPGETREDRLATLRLIERLLEAGGSRNHFTYRHYQPTWETPLGDEALSHAPQRARRIDTWLPEHARYADPGERTMPWLPATDERELKQLIDFDLPLATSRLELRASWRRGVYARLRARAQARLRTGERASAVERWIYERCVGRALDRTFVP